MKKEKIIDSEMMRTLARLLYEEYLECQLRVLALDDPHVQKRVDMITQYSSRQPRKDRGAYGYFDWMKNSIGDGENKSYYRGYIVVPEILLQEGLLRGGAKEARIEEIMERPGGIYEFFMNEPRDGVTVIRKDEIVYGPVLLSIDPAEKISGPIDTILRQYIPDVSRPGTRTWTSAGAAVLLNNIPELEEILKNKGELMNSIDQHSFPKFYDGNVYCKCQSSDEDPTTAPLLIFSSDEIAAARFSFQTAGEFKRGFTRNKDFFTESADPRRRYTFHKEVIGDEAMVGFLEICKYEASIKDVTTREFLLSPAEIGINLSDYKQNYPILFK